MKIKTIEIFRAGNCGWKEVEFYGLEDIELLNKMIWKDGGTTFCTI